MIICASRILAQKIIRFCMAIPFLNGVGVLLAHYSIALFRKVCSSEPVLSTYDGDVKIWLRLTSLLEANIYFLGVDAKDRGEVVLLKRLLQPDWVALDVGGNVGQIALLMAKRVPQGMVHVFEPSSDNFRRLQSNVRLNSFTNIITNHAAVSNQAATIEIFAPRTYNTGAISIYPDRSWEMDSETVSAIRLDDYSRDQNLAAIALIKIDVEGAEMDVLEGAIGLLQNQRPVVLMEVTASILQRANHSPADIFRFWQSLDYSVYAIDDRGKLRVIQHEGEMGEDQNICCCPHEKRVIIESSILG